MRNNLKKSDNAVIFAKVPPQAVDLEALVIGSCINEGRAIFEDVNALITDARAFYKEEHRIIYAAMQRLYEKGYGLDLFLLQDELKKTGELEIVGGAHYITHICHSVMSDAFALHYAKIVFEKFLAREVIRLSGEAINEAYDDATDSFNLIDKTSDALYQLSSISLQREPLDADKIGAAFIKDLDAQIESGINVTGITSGFTKLDDITNGWQHTDLTILAGRPSIGKTAFALALAASALSIDAGVMIFSLEMGKKQIAGRMLSTLSEVPLRTILRPNEMSEQENKRLRTAVEVYRGLPLYVDDTAGISLFDMRAKVRRMRQKYGIQLVLVDYLQLMSGTGKEGNREQEISRISRGLKALAKDFEIPVIALSQLSRAIEGGSGAASRDPKLSDLRESGAIEQDADNVLFITNPNAELLAANAKYMDMKLIDIAKGRNIGVGRVCLHFNNEIQKFTEPIFL